MANGRINPQQSNVLGRVNQDTSFGPEFTFHHGHVEKVVLEPSDLDSFGYPIYGVPSDVSQCILLRPTYGGHLDFALPSNYLKGMVLAQPLLRGFADSIARGDSVIYTNLGSKFYYLGPINTLNNPNYSPDTLHNPDLNPNRVVLDDRKDHEDGYNVNFIRRVINRVTKIKNIILDRPYDTGVGEVGSDAEIEANVSDLTLEGRHGNSIQLGYRFINPYSIIRNNSSSGNNGSVLGMLSLGTIPDYFPSTDVDENGNPIPYQLSVNKVVKETGYIGFPINAGNDIIDGENKFQIDFGAVENEAELQTELDQIIMFSDRITFDAQDNDFTVSAKRNINFGAGKNFTITNKGFTVIESQNIYIGKEAKNKTEPIVLGDKLRDILLDIMKLINDSRALVQGVPIPLVDQSSKLLSGPQSRIQKLIDELEPRTYEKDENGKDIKTKPKIENEKGKETRFFSQQHYIEINRS
jgi:hypothetical protein